MRVRPIEIDDLPSVSKVMSTVGWKALTPKRWIRDWDLNPALAGDTPAFARGWVLTDEDDIVGFIGNLVQSFQWNGRLLRSACAWGFVVLPRARGNSMRLLMAYARQPNVDLLLNTTATPKVPEIFETLGFKKLPQADFDVGLYWASAPSGLIAAALRRMGAPIFLAKLSGLALAPLIWLDTKVRRRSPRRSPDETLEIETITPDQIDSDFDELWKTKAAEDSRCLGLRSADVLRWHFDSRWRASVPIVITARRQGRLLGYAILVRHDREHTGLTRYHVADMLVLEDEPNVVTALLHRSYVQSVKDGVHMLELAGHPDTIRSVARESSPRRWRKSAWPYLFKATDSSLSDPLSRPNSWYATLLDGDGSLEAVPE